MAFEGLWVYLDDCRPMPQGYHILVKTAKEAIEQLQTGQVSQISLDHDLGEESEVGSGYMVAKWIEEAAYNRVLRPLVVVLHTANSVGRQNMLVAIKNAERYWESHRNSDSTPIQGGIIQSAEDQTV